MRRWKGRGSGWCRDTTLDRAPSRRRAHRVLKKSGLQPSNGQLVAQACFRSWCWMHMSRRAHWGRIPELGGQNHRRLDATARPRSRRSAPAASKHFTNRSTLTVGSAASIFATLDWLDPTLFASSACVQLCSSRSSRSRRASESLISTNSDSPGVSFRNSRASPTRHPADSSLRCFAALIFNSPVLVPYNDASVSCIDPRPALEWYGSSSRKRQVSRSPPNRCGK